MTTSFMSSHLNTLDSLALTTSLQFEESSQSTLATVAEGDLLKPQGGETFDEESSFAYLGLDVEGCIDPVMEDCHGEDATHSPRTFAPIETFYSFLLDQPARKQVPIGPDHQAMIPEWEDRGSIRCVHQHVKESREDMVKVLGSEKFRDMGFCDMGEEVAQRWSDEDALLFHEIVYSYPVTLGQNFWKHLEAVFLSRTKHEINCAKKEETGLGDEQKKVEGVLVWSTGKLTAFLEEFWFVGVSPETCVVKGETHGVLGGAISGAPLTATACGSVGDLLHLGSTVRCDGDPNGGVMRRLVKVVLVLGSRGKRVGGFVSPEESTGGRTLQWVHGGGSHPSAGW
ncbi:hypothetical protein DY000_02008559 [Brassica cretica]|uniref:Uncharacterized protein n=1 Tax=Brassica cretica TaxID=69181 RepID=A0ABQ7C5I0_BRACR|nr:hypothetical protein DY000_02008559 [Brassica cretica]